MDIGVNNSKDKINITLSQGLLRFGFPAFIPVWFSKDQDSRVFLDFGLFVCAIDNVKMVRIQDVLNLIRSMNGILR